MEFPPLPYIAVPESFKLPPGANFGGTSGVAFNSKGNIFVLHRGPMPMMEFDGAIERDARSGKLDAHAEEALAAHRAGYSREL